jgi:hypothetical protein
MAKMILTQILLPLYDNSGRRLSPQLHRTVKLELSQRFGGLTAYSRSPAQGLWRRKSSIQREEIVVYEVMSKLPHSRWWLAYRKELEKRFQQSVVVVRAQQILVI